jgi:hypothetical protein
MQTYVVGVVGVEVELGVDVTGAEVIPDEEAGSADEDDTVDEAGFEELDPDERVAEELVAEELVAEELVAEELGVDDELALDEELASEDGVEDELEEEDILPEAEDVADGTADDDDVLPEDDGCEVDIELRKVVALETDEVLTPELLELELDELV